MIFESLVSHLKLERGQTPLSLDARRSGGLFFCWVQRPRKGMIFECLVSHLKLERGQTPLSLDARRSGGLFLLGSASPEGDDIRVPGESPETGKGTNAVIP
ncbi:MAG: hypothetical protein KatS3mg045_0734 [Bellilinea sp.]|nr:MAG: hypothetical protein KatS3mg045_0734 [Bellilinea sp.]